MPLGPEAPAAELVPSAAVGARSGGRLARKSCRSPARDPKIGGVALHQIVSGGQTGADRGALAAARDAGLSIGGWVPRGRAAEDGRVPDELVGLRETPSAEPAERTRWNVRDSDGTLIVSHGPLRGGSALTLELAEQLRRPVLWLDLAALPLTRAIEETRAWLERHALRVLNVAGPRASEDPEAYAGAYAVVAGLLRS